MRGASALSQNWAFFSNQSHSIPAQPPGGFLEHLNKKSETQIFFLGHYFFRKRKVFLQKSAPIQRLVPTWSLWPTSVLIYDCLQAYFSFAISKYLQSPSDTYWPIPNFFENEEENSSTRKFLFSGTMNENTVDDLLCDSQLCDLCSFMTEKKLTKCFS